MQAVRQGLSVVFGRRYRLLRVMLGLILLLVTVSILDYFRRSQPLQSRDVIASEVVKPDPPTYAIRCRFTLNDRTSWSPDGVRRRPQRVASAAGPDLRGGGQGARAPNQQRAPTKPLKSYFWFNYRPTTYALLTSRIIFFVFY